MTANELADELQELDSKLHLINLFKAATMLRQQAQEIEDLKNANRFIQNFAEEQHQRVVALEMHELTDEEIEEVARPYCDLQNWVVDKHEFARAILKKASERA
jgi:hypothetical protein